MNKPTFNVDFWSESINPWIGCTEVSPGCAHCWARTLMQDRMSKAKWGKNEQRIFTKGFAAKLRKVKKNPAVSRCPTCNHFDHPNVEQCTVCNGKMKVYPSIIFIGNIMDFFEDRNDPEMYVAREVVYEFIDANPMIYFVFVTKRPQHVIDLSSSPHLHKNVITMVSVENQDMWVQRMPYVVQLASSGYQTGVIFEPWIGYAGNADLATCLAPATENYALSTNDWEQPRIVQPWNYGAIRWVIFGGETGHNARRTTEASAIAIHDLAESAGVPYFYKKNGDANTGWQDRSFMWKHEYPVAYEKLREQYYE